MTDVIVVAMLRILFGVMVVYGENEILVWWIGLWCRNVRTGLLVQEICLILERQSLFQLPVNGKAILVFLIHM